MKKTPVNNNLSDAIKAADDSCRQSYDALLKSVDDFIEKDKKGIINPRCPECNGTMSRKKYDAAIGKLVYECNFCKKEWV